MLTATKNKVWMIVAAAALALMLMAAPLGVASTFACDPEFPTSTGC